MANPQPENGYIRIATELVDAFCTFKFSGNQWLVLWFIIRKTYGWQKKKDKISYSQMAVGTGLSRRECVKVVKQLASIGSVQKDTTCPVTLSIVKDYTKWKLVSKKTPSVQKDTRLVSKKTPKLVSKKTPTIDNKDTIQKIHDVFGFFLIKTKTKYKLNDKRKKMIASLLKDYSVEELKIAVQMFSEDEWDGRKNHTDPIYCFGTVRGIDNVEKWLNKKDKIKPKERML